MNNRRQKKSRWHFAFRFPRRTKQLLWPRHTSISTALSQNGSIYKSDRRGFEVRLFLHYGPRNVADISVGRIAQDGSVPDPGRQGPTLPYSPPLFPLGDANIDAFFGGENCQTGDHNDSDGLLNRQMISESHACLVACILQIPRNQFIEIKVGTASSSGYPPKTKNDQSYWQQLDAL